MNNAENSNNEKNQQLNIAGVSVSLPDNWEDKLYDEYGFGITKENWLKGYDNDGKFYYSEEDMRFLIAVFSELLRRNER
jgi:hypothetical protein